MTTLKKTLPVVLALWGLVTWALMTPLACSKSPTAPATPTATAVPTATNWGGYTSTATLIPTQTNIPTSTPTPSVTLSPTNTYPPGTITPTNIATSTPTVTDTYTPPYMPPNTGTPTVTLTPTNTFTPTVTFSSPIPTIIPSTPIPSYTPGSVPWQVDAPNGLAQSPSGGNIYVAFGNGLPSSDTSYVPGGVKIFNPNGVPQGTIPSYPGSEANGVAVDSNGYIYVTDENGKVYVFNSSSSAVTSWSSWTSTVVGGKGAFNEPEGIAVDASNNVYVADTGNAWVEVFGPYTGLSNSNQPVTEFNQTSGAATFLIPSAVALDSSNNIYVADAGNGLVSVFNPLSPLATYTPTPIPIPASPVTQWPTQANSDIWGITVNNGNVYVADTYNGQIEVYTTGGTLLDLWTGPYPTDQSSPDGVIVTAGNQVLVTDFFNNLVEDFSNP